MKQSELKKNINSFYLEELSRSIKREKTLKSQYAEKEPVAILTEQEEKRKKFKKYFTEDEEGNVQMGSGTQGSLDGEQGMEPEENAEDDIDVENKDALDEADEILSQINLHEISNGVRLELIEAIIDSAQNAVDGEETNDGDFSEFMQSISDIVEGFRYDGEEEEEGELGADDGLDEEPLDMEAPEENPMPEMQEENVRPNRSKSKMLNETILKNRKK